MSDPQPGDAAAATAAGHWPQVRALFEQLLPLDAAERRARLEAGGQPQEVRAEVEALLGHAQEADAEFLAPGPPGAVPALAPGEVLGGWRIAERLGAGGMGEVWRAERADGTYEGQAAVKVLPARLGGPELEARFAVERRALARLDHPHIARLLDAGRTVAGAPYVVMEYVAGVPIDRACIGRTLAVRVGLFLQLCDAVAHAHRQLLLHRDLKPGNVLVSPAGEVKLLDFGIAKMLDQPDAELTQGAALFTPLYASPEQVRGEPVGTASDVHALGALLFRLLTGQRPLARGVEGALAVAQAVLHEQPRRPSAVVAEPAVRAEDPALPLPRQLAGDLDTIVLKALQKQPADRYASVDALAADLRAWRDGYPVAARPAPLGLRATKFVERNRMASAFGGLAVLALLAGLLATATQMQRADAAREVAERRLADLRAVARQVVFRYHDQIQHLPGAVAVRGALLDDATQLLDGLARDNVAEPGMQRELAETYHRLSVLQGESFSPGLERVQAALDAAGKATALQARYLTAASPAPERHAAVDMWLHRATVEARLGRIDTSLASLQQARAISAAGDPQDLELISRRATLEGRIALALGASFGQASLGRVAEARAHWEAAIAGFDQIVEQAPGTAEWNHQLAWGWVGMAAWAIVDGRFDLAVAAAARAVALRDRAAALAPGNAHYAHQRAMARSNLGSALALAGQPAAGLAVQAEALAMIRATTAADASNRVAARDGALVTLSQARALLALGRRAEARAAVQVALDALPNEALAGGDFYLARWRSEALVWRARIERANAPEAALASAREATQLLEQLPGPAHAARAWALGQARLEQAEALAALGRADSAREAAAAALRDWGGAEPGYFREQAARARSLAAAP